MIAKIEADPNLARNDKDAQIDMLTRIKEIFEKTALFSYIAQIIVVRFLCCLS